MCVIKGCLKGGDVQVVHWCPGTAQLASCMTKKMRPAIGLSLCLFHSGHCLRPDGEENLRSMRVIYRCDCSTSKVSKFSVFLTVRISPNEQLVLLYGRQLLFTGTLFTDYLTFPRNSVFFVFTYVAPAALTRKEKVGLVLMHGAVRATSKLWIIVTQASSRVRCRGANREQYIRRANKARPTPLLVHG